MRRFYCIKCGTELHTELLAPEMTRDPGVLAFGCPEQCGAVVMLDVDAGAVRRVSTMSPWSDLPHYSTEDEGVSP